MILTCPNCGTQYVVKDGAIPPEGRQVRCAACKHSWHQDPDADPSIVPVPEAAAGEETVAREDAPSDPSAAPAETEAADPIEPDEDGAETESLTEATLIDPRSGPEAEQRAYEEAVIGIHGRGTGSAES